jgi:hypothetical protein
MSVGAAKAAPGKRLKAAVATDPANMSLRPSFAAKIFSMPYV